MVSNSRVGRKTGGRVGGWRGIGLRRGSYVLAENRLRPFPTAPLRTARESFDLKRLASGLCFMTPKTVSAFRISRTLTSGSSDHLSPFAMWRAFPTSDYYGDSVTLGLAPVRSSHVPLVLNVSSAT